MPCPSSAPPTRSSPRSYSPTLLRRCLRCWSSLTACGPSAPAMGCRGANFHVAVLHSLNQPVDGGVEYLRFVLMHGHVRHGQAQRDMHENIACVNGLFLRKAVPLEHPDQPRRVGNDDVAARDGHQTRQTGPLHERAAKRLTPTAHTVLPT